MIQHLWSVVCRKSIIDSETNNITLTNILEQLSVNITPAKNGQKLNKPDTLINVPIEFEVVSMWLNKKSEDFHGNFYLDFVNPSGKILKTFTQDMNMPVKMKRLRSRVRIFGLPLDNISGDYIFKIKIKERNDKNFTNVVEVPLEVILLKEEVNQKKKNSKNN